MGGEKLSRELFKKLVGKKSRRDLILFLSMAGLGALMILSGLICLMLAGFKFKLYSAENWLLAGLLVSGFILLIIGGVGVMSLIVHFHGHEAKNGDESQE
ncbi:MAG: hypothetical protein WC858_01195 [Parcubacteria group bacterium]